MVARVSPRDYFQLQNPQVETRTEYKYVPRGIPFSQLGELKEFIFILQVTIQ